MKQFLALLLTLTLAIVTFADDKGYKVKYDGGSLTGVDPGKDVRLFVEPTQIRIVRNKVEVAAIPATAVTELSYGQDVHRRVGAAIGIGVVTLGIGALMALTKSKKHFIGITWSDGDNKGGLAIQANKKEYRGILLGLEGITGLKTVNTDTLAVEN